MEGKTLSVKGPFRHVGAKRPQPTDIESLFKDLKNRDPSIRDLYSHQADVLREYSSSHLTSKDVSIELPTGSGKTLVGLLIAEYRRKILNERILYICPTKQLAHQVGNQSKDYGIPTKVLVGSKRQYDRQDVRSYRSARATAVSTYSGLFNSNPEFDDAQTIVLDDAHGGESYISSLWSIVIERGESPDIYTKVLSIFEKDLPASFLSILNDANRPLSLPKPEKVPFGPYFRNLDKLRGILDQSLPNPDVSDLYFSWQSVRNGLQACHVYISWDEILIRPYIPPTLIHRPFALANQRVYMSATLGSGGELERITGIGHIQRVSTPKTYLTRGIGRRLFVFPDLADDPAGYEPWLEKIIRSNSRVLALCPTGASAQALTKIVKQITPPPRILGAKDIENSMTSFSSSRSAILILANRYDGLDIPSKDCRLLLIYGLPTGTNLQERFLEEKLGLDVLLRERVKTRIAQASGRCTRSDTDYAAVVMIGKRLLNFCMKRENESLFNPELRAEVQFSLEQEVKDTAKLDLMLKSFFDKDENWAGAELDIAALRETQINGDTTIGDILSKVVADEVDFSYYLWSGAYKDAVKHGRAVTDHLSDSRLAAYRALWYYFAAYAAYMASQVDQQYGKIAENLMGRSVQTCRTVSWFANALKSALPEGRLRSVASELETIATEGIADVLQDLGATGPGFQRKMKEVKALLSQKGSTKFDRGMLELGRLLGFDSWKPDLEAAPDCVWQLGNGLVFLLEGKSEASPEGRVSIEDCRQAGGHLKWATAEQKLSDCKAIYSILVTPKSQLDVNATPHAKGLYLVQPTEMAKLFDRAEPALLAMRSEMTDEMSEEFKEGILSELISNELTPATIQELLLSKPAAGRSKSNPDAIQPSES